MKTYADPDMEAARQLAVIDAEIDWMERDLDAIGKRPSAGAAMQSRRAERAALIRRQLDWLLPMRAEMAAEVGQ